VSSKYHVERPTRPPQALEEGRCGACETAGWRKYLTGVLEHDLNVSSRSVQKLGVELTRCRGQENDLNVVSKRVTAWGVGFGTSGASRINGSRRKG